MHTLIAQALMLVLAVPCSLPTPRSLSANDITVRVVECTTDAAGCFSATIAVRNETSRAIYIHKCLGNVYANYEQPAVDDDHGIAFCASIRGLPLHIGRASLRMVESKEEMQETITVSPRDGYVLNRVRVRVLFGDDPDSFRLGDRSRLKSSEPVDIWQKP